MVVNTPKKCLVTGGAGFIGSHLVDCLLREGYQVRILDNFSSGKMSNIADFLERGVELIEADIRDYPVVERACTGVDFILHQAAVASVYYSIQEPRITHDINVNGTLNVLEAASKCGVRRVNLASSAAVYGLNESLPKSEDMSPLPVSPYGYHKWMNEQYAKLYSEQFGVPVTCFRYFNVFGPRQDAKSPYSGVISIFIDDVLSGKEPTIYGDGHQSRDFVSVHDICQANLLAIKSNMLVNFNVFNIGGGRSYSLLDLLDSIQRITQKSFKIRHQEERRGDLRHSVASLGHIRETLGYQPKVPFELALEELVTFAESQMCLKGSNRLVS